MYPPRQVRFSFHYPLNMAAVKANAPEAPGVYEIPLAEMKIDYPLCPSGGGVHRQRKEHQEAT